MANYNERQIEELNKVAEKFALQYGDAMWRVEIPELEIRSMRKETVHYYERVEHFIQTLLPKSKKESTRTYETASETWRRLRSEALKAAEIDLEE